MSTKKKPPEKPDADVDSDETEMVGARVPTWLKAKYNALAKKNRRSLATEILIALEERLKALGEWPEGQ